MTNVRQEDDDAYYDELSIKYVESWKSLVQAIVAIGTLGAGFVFTVIFSDIKLPPRLVPPLSSQSDTDATVAYIRTCLMVGWLLFVIALVSSAITIAYLDNRKLDVMLAKHSKEGFTTFTQRMRFMPVLVLFLLLLPLGAFIAVALALRPYNSALGIAAIVIIVVGGLGVVCYFIMRQIQQTMEHSPGGDAADDINIERGPGEPSEAKTEGQERQQTPAFTPKPHRRPPIHRPHRPMRKVASHLSSGIRIAR